MYRISCCTILVCVFVISSGHLFSQVPKSISYQGVLYDNQNNLVPDGNYQLRFGIYTAPTSTEVLWSEEQIIPVVNGVVSAILGSVAPLDLPFDRQYWLGIAVDDGEDLFPRIALTSSVYSLRAGSIDDGQVVKSINTLMDDVLLEAGDNVSIVKEDNKIIISASGSEEGGGITGITAGEGLTGGGTEGNVTLTVANGGITTNKIAAGAVDASKLTNNAVTTLKINDGAVTSVKIANSAINDPAKVASGSLRMSHLRSVQGSTGTGNITIAAGACRLFESPTSVEGRDRGDIVVSPPTNDLPPGVVFIPVIMSREGFIARLVCNYSNAPVTFNASHNFYTLRQ
jgi:hypothetical protein